LWAARLVVLKVA